MLWDDRLVRVTRHARQLRLQLHRPARLVPAAPCLHPMDLQAMEERGYNHQTLRRKLKRQLLAWPGIYDSSPASLLHAIDTTLQRLLAG